MLAPSLFTVLALAATVSARPACRGPATGPATGSAVDTTTDSAIETTTGSAIDTATVSDIDTATVPTTVPTTVSTTVPTSAPTTALANDTDTTTASAIGTTTGLANDTDTTTASATGTTTGPATVPTNGTTTGPASGSKLGIAWPIQEGDSAPVDKFFANGSKVSWWYDWNMNFEEVVPGAKAAGEFVPMIWTSSWLDSPLTIPKDSKMVMGFNEPDSDHEAIAKALTPAEAATRWQHFVEMTRAINPEIELISPSVATDQNWLKEFFAAICPSGLDGCDVAPKYLAVHSYRFAAVDWIANIQSYYDNFKLPIIVTEFACLSGWKENSPKPSEQQVSDFMSTTTEWLDAQDFIYRYSWFGAVRNKEYLYAVPEQNRLMDEAGNLTPLGVQYVGGGRK